MEGQKRAHRHSWLQETSTRPRPAVRDETSPGAGRKLTEKPNYPIELATALATDAALAIGDVPEPRIPPLDDIAAAAARDIEIADATKEVIEMEDDDVPATLKIPDAAGDIVPTTMTQNTITAERWRKPAL